MNFLQNKCKFRAGGILTVLFFLCSTSVSARNVATAVPERTHTLSLRANWLRWVTLTPDLGLEWHIDRRWSVLLNGSWTSWSWENTRRRYALWTVMPEARYYIGGENCGYVGVMFKTGSFNYKLSVTGRQGDITGGGITGGYVLRLSRRIDMDFSIAAGCIHAGFDRYVVNDGVRLYRESDTENRWGIINLGVTLILNLQ